MPIGEVVGYYAIQPDVVRLVRKVFGNLEFVADADLERVLVGGGKQAVVPSTSVAEALSALGECEPGDDPDGDLRGLDDLRLRRLEDVHRSAPEVTFGKTLQLRKFVDLAVPARRDDFDASVEHFEDEFRKVDLIRRGEVYRDCTAAVKRVCGDCDRSVVDQLGANDL